MMFDLERQSGTAFGSTRPEGEPQLLAIRLSQNQEESLKVPALTVGSQV
ncbi:MAG: hypothetical protein WBR10_15065 [Candidatus Acidiferrum sp.]